MDDTTPEDLQASLVLTKGQEAFTLLDKERIILRHGPFKKRAEKGLLRGVPKRELWLFNDLLLIVKDTGNPNKRPYKAHLMLDSCTVCLDGYDEKHKAFTFMVKCGEQEFGFMHEEKRKVESWVKAMQNQIAALKQRAEPVDKRGWIHGLVTGTLFSAVMANDVAALRMALEKRDEFGAPAFDINERDDSGCTPLWLAAFHGYDALASVLLHAGADPAVASDDMVTPLHVAAVRGHVATVQALLDGGADPASLVDLDDRGALFVAAVRLAEFEARVAAEDMAAKGGAGEEVKTDGRSGGGSSRGGGAGDVYDARHMNKAAVHRSLQLLAEAGAPLDARDAHGLTVLMAVAGTPSSDTATLLLELGADVSASRADGATPLHLACGPPPLVVSGDRSVDALAGPEGPVVQPAMVETLLRFGSQPNARDVASATPLMILLRTTSRCTGTAAAVRDATIQVLLRYGAQTGIPDASGTTPADFAVSNALALPTVPRLPQSANARRWASVLTPQEAEWVKDDASPHCMLCGSQFTFTFRRHHCRHCAVLVCSRCSAVKFPLCIPLSSPPRDQRTCDACFNLLNTRADALSSVPGHQLEATMRRMGLKREPRTGPSGKGHVAKAASARGVGAPASGGDARFASVGGRSLRAQRERMSLMGGATEAASAPGTPGGGAGSVASSSSASSAQAGRATASGPARGRGAAMREQADAMAGTKEAMTHAQAALAERGEKIATLRDMTDRLDSHASDFEQIAKQLAEREANRKWYHF